MHYYLIIIIIIIIYMHNNFINELVEILKIFSTYLVSWSFYFILKIVFNLSNHVV